MNDDYVDADNDVGNDSDSNDVARKKSVFITFREIVLNFAEFGRMFRIRLSRPNSKELISDCRETESH